MSYEPSRWNGAGGWGSLVRSRLGLLRGSEPAWGAGQGERARMREPERWRALAPPMSVFPPYLEVVDDVDLEVPAGAWEAQVAFYERLVGLPPASSEHRPAEGLGAFRSGLNRLRLRRSDIDEIEAGMETRLTVVVPRLLEVEKRLAWVGLCWEVFRGLGPSERRVVAADPAGYRVAFKQVWRV